MHRRLIPALVLITLAVSACGGTPPATIVSAPASVVPAVGGTLPTAGSAQSVEDTARQVLTALDQEDVVTLNQVLDDKMSLKDLQITDAIRSWRDRKHKPDYGTFNSVTVQPAEQRGATTQVVAKIRYTRVVMDATFAFRQTPDGGWRLVQWEFYNNTTESAALQKSLYDATDTAQTAVLVGASAAPTVSALPAATSPVASAGNTAHTLRISVTTEAGAPMPGITFTVAADGQNRTVATGTDGTLTVADIHADEARIVGATDASGKPLTMSENDPAGGLRLRFAGQPQLTRAFLGYPGELVSPPMGDPSAALVSTLDVPGRRVPDRVMATHTAPSSQDSAGNTVSYQAANVSDLDADTAWRVAGNGKGEALTLTFAQAITVREVRVIPGYAKRDAQDTTDRFAQNRRITKARLEFSEGSHVDATFADAPTAQPIAVPNVKTTFVRLVIMETTAPGAQQGRDFTAISELVVVGR